MPLSLVCMYLRDRPCVLSLLLFLPVVCACVCPCSGEENISIIVAPIFEGFQLSSLGSPQQAAQQFLDTIAAPAGSDKTAALVAAEQRCGYSFQSFTGAGPL